MFRWKILKTLVVLFPLIVAFSSPFLEPIKRRILNGSDLRAYLSQDTVYRTQTLALHNAGEANLSKVIVEFDIPNNVDKPIADFYYGSSYAAPPTSFVETFAHSDAWTHLPKGEMETVAAIADDHSSSRTLYNLDQALDNNLLAELRMDKALAKTLAAQSSGSYDDWHLFWKRQCEARKYSESQCRPTNETLESWESTKRNLQMDALKRWYETTGVALIPPSRQLSSNGQVYFSFALGPEQSGYLTVVYGPNPMPMSTPTIISIPERMITPVQNRAELSASSLWIFWHYYPVLTIFWGVTIFVCIWIVWPVIRPLSLLPTYKVFNLALKTDDPEHWEMASQRHKFHVYGVYRELWSRFKGTDIEHSPEEMFDYIKSCCKAEKKKRLFANEIALNKFIRVELRKLVRLP